MRGCSEVPAVATPAWRQSRLMQWIPVFPAPVPRLLGSSLVFVMGRAVSLPLVVLYLAQALQLSQTRIGWMLAFASLVATLSGPLAGMLADRIAKTRLMAIACMIAAAAVLMLSVSPNAGFAMLALAAIEAALVLRSVSLKALLADYLPGELRARAFSMNYLMINLGFTIGPLIGAGLFAYWIAAPFWLAAIFILAAGWMVRDSAMQRSQAASLPLAESSAAKTSLRETLQALRSDRILLLFTLASILTSFVFGRFISGYLAQYLIAVYGAQQAAGTITTVLVTNAVMVVCLQYLVGSRMQNRHLLRWITAGVGFYLLGLTGYAVSDSKLSWILATVVFSLGEIIVVPCEYLFIDLIAPSSQRGAYYGVQTLASLGTALNAVVCAYLLTHAGSTAMFATLIIAGLLGVTLYATGWFLRQRRAVQITSCDPHATPEFHEYSDAIRLLAGNAVRGLRNLS
ncbi:MFS transporter [Undibacterium squillarum]|uniref:MFS transporter n=1 Tax=Undibacterium squillarum TaxID=1131567 RepID=UPI0035B1344E